MCVGGGVWGRSETRSAAAARSGGGGGVALHGVGLGGNACEPAHKRVVRVGRRRCAKRFRSHLHEDLSYKLSGEYDKAQRRLHLRESQTEQLNHGWKACDALAFLSADFSTLSGVALCEHKGACDAGIGQRPKVQFARVTVIDLRARRRRRVCIAPRQGRAVDRGRRRQPRQRPLHEQGSGGIPARRRKGRQSDGQAPDLRRRAGLRAGLRRLRRPVRPRARRRRPIRALVPGASVVPVLEYGRNRRPVLVISEDVYPPEAGWRPVGIARGPPPTIRTSVRSLYALLPEHQRLRAGAAKVKSSRTHSLVALAAGGAFLWALVYVLSKKMRLSPRAANAGKHFPSPR